jgi:peptide chain release factor 2
VGADKVLPGMQIIFDGGRVAALESVVDQVKAAQALGTRGIALFEWREHLQDTVLPYVANGLWRTGRYKLEFRPVPAEQLPPKAVIGAKLDVAPKDKRALIDDFEDGNLVNAQHAAWSAEADSNGLGTRLDAQPLRPIEPGAGKSKYAVKLKVELNAGAKVLEDRLAALDFTRMLSGPYDRLGAVLTIQPGAGGVESMDWAQMLMRMYTRWAERRGFKIELLDLQPGEEAGVKNVTLKVNGDWAFGLLRAEKGVHRLVRVSPFDSAGRRHTSFASVESVPQLEEEAEIEIPEKDLKIDVFRASGAGGQHVNRTESAVRITHLPTGLVTQCQNDRSQMKNRESAMSVLKARLWVIKQEEQKAKLEGIAGEKAGINFGSQIRNYVLFPYQLVKDVRTDVETSQTQAVLDGDIDLFIESYLKQASGGAVHA